MTALQIIQAALRLIGVLASGESLSASEATDGLVSLNNMLDSWSNEKLIAFPVLREAFPLSSAGLLQTYSWGAAGVLTSARPISIKKAIIQLSGSSPAIEFPMTILNVDEYAAVVLKTLTSNFPLYCYIDDAYPNKNVSVWPVPTDSTNSLVFYSTKPLASGVLNTAMSVPPGYLRAMIFNLAIDLAPEYGRQVPSDVATIAVTSKADIKRTNTKPVYLGMDSALKAMRGAYNWRTDGYEK